MSEQKRELRPWNVRPGDRMHGLEVFGFRTPDGSGRSSGTVESVVPDRRLLPRPARRGLAVGIGTVLSELSVLSEMCRLLHSQARRREA